MEQDLLHPREASERLGVSLRTVWRLIAAGQLPAVSIGTNLDFPRKRIRRSDLEAFIQERTNA